MPLGNTKLLLIRILYLTATDLQEMRLAECGAEQLSGRPGAWFASVHVRARSPGPVCPARGGAHSLVSVWVGAASHSARWAAGEASLSAPGSPLVASPPCPCGQ